VTETRHTARIAPRSFSTLTNLEALGNHYNREQHARGCGVGCGAQLHRAAASHCSLQGGDGAAAFKLAFATANATANATAREARHNPPATASRDALMALQVYSMLRGVVTVVSRTRRGWSEGPGRPPGPAPLTAAVTVPSGRESIPTLTHATRPDTQHHAAWHRVPAYCEACALLVWHSSAQNAWQAHSSSWARIGSLAQARRCLSVPRLSSRKCAVLAKANLTRCQHFCAVRFPQRHRGAHPGVLQARVVVQGTPHESRSGSWFVIARLPLSQP
jgi:hypothetical protein